LPEDVLHAHPWLNFYMGMVQWWQSQYAAAQQVLEKALAAFEARNDQRGCGEAMVQLSIVHQTQGDFAPALDYIHRALDRPISPRSRCQSFMALAWLSLAQGQLELAANQVDMALTLAETGSDDGAVNICMIQTRFVFECVPGGPTLFPRLIHLLETKHPAPLSPRQGAIFGTQLFIHLLEGNVAEAIAAGEQARSISQQLGGLSWLLVDTATILAILYSLRGDAHRFDAQVVENEPLMEMFPGWRRIILYAYGYMYWTQGRLDKMEAMFVRMQTVLPNEWPTARVCFEAMQGVRAMVANDWTTAKTAFHKALDLQQHTPVAGIFADTRLLLALVHERCHEPDRAIHYIRAVLDEYVERDKPGLVLLAGRPLIPILKLAIDRKIHVNICQHLLAQLTSDHLPEPLFVPQTQATLTAREVEVLRLLMGGASNQEIAETLIISLPTVKTHVSRILNKLNVKSRAAVVARVQELNLPL
jgi:DNA-binding CsgD family transcriptional regulator/tetratricopeptide (TPR) repeat protein